MTHYLNERHRLRVHALVREALARHEWQTWLLIIAVHGGWLAAAGSRQHLGLAPATVLLMLCSVLHMSLQHELLHGHPTRNEAINKLLGYAPYAVWYPYTLYRESHLRHHDDENLTYPGLDPESHYVSPQDWRASPAAMRLLYRMRKTFWGRLFIGPAMAIAAMLREEAGRLFRGDLRRLAMWLCHGMLLAAMLYGLERWAGIPWWHYLACVAYPALGIAMIRSHFEHRAAEQHAHRIVINEAGLFMRALFLNNNYHLVHHDLPHLPWYLLPRVYREHRAAYLRRCDGFLLRGYIDLARRHGFTPVDEPPHPLMPCKSRESLGSLQ
jgi:fatty acid desaturase